MGSMGHTGGQNSQAVLLWLGGYQQIACYLAVYRCCWDLTEKKILSTTPDAPYFGFMHQNNFELPAPMTYSLVLGSSWQTAAAYFLNDSYNHSHSDVQIGRGNTTTVHSRCD